MHKAQYSTMQKKGLTSQVASSQITMQCNTIYRTTEDLPLRGPHATLYITSTNTTTTTTTSTTTTTTTEKESPLII